MELKRIAIDTSKHVFTLHGVDVADRPVLRRELRRAQVEPFFRKLPPTEVALEACGGSRTIGGACSAAGPLGAADPAAIRETLCQARQERSH